MPTTKHHRFLPLFLLLVTSMIWGSSFLLMKRGLVVFSAPQVGLIRIGFAYLVLLPVALRSVSTIGKRQAFFFLIAGLCGNLLPAIFFALAETSLSSSMTGVLNALTPLFTLLIGVVIFKLRMHLRQLSGIGLGLIGSIILSLTAATGSFGVFNYYVLFVFVATLLYGFNVNWIKQKLSDVPPLQLTAMALFFVGPIALIFLFGTDFIVRLSHTTGSWKALGYIAILGIVNTAFTLILFFKFLRLTDAVTASSVTYIIPVFALLFGFLDGEAVYPFHLLGLLLILGGVYLVKRN